MKFTELNPEDRERMRLIISDNEERVLRNQKDSGERLVKYLLLVNAGGVVASLSFMGAFHEMVGSCWAVATLILFLTGVVLSGFLAIFEYLISRNAVSKFQDLVLAYVNGEYEFSEMQFLYKSELEKTWVYKAIHACWIMGFVAFVLGVVFAGKTFI